MTELCQVWADLAADPESAAAVAAARSRFVELTAHVGTCEACALIGESMPFPERVFAVLGEENVTLSREEWEEIRAMDELLATDPDAIAEGVEYLLAGLPRRLNTSMDPMRLFRAIEAIAALVRSGATPDRTAAVDAIMQQTDVPEAVAESLWSWQLEVVKYCPTLYSDTPDLIVRWMPRASHSNDELDDILDELKEAVAAGSRLLEMAPADEKFGKLVEQIHSENAKIVEMMAPFAVAGAGGAGGAGGEDTAVSIAGVVECLRAAEQRKRRCLDAIAKAPLARLGGSESAIQFQAFAAASLVVVRRSIIELQKLSGVLSPIERHRGRW